MERDKWFERTLIFLGIIGLAVLLYVGFTPNAQAAQTVCQIPNGCTGLGTNPTYGQLLVGNGNGGYSLLATSSLGITSGVSSVFGRTGAVTAQTGDYTTSQVTEGSNLYFTNARAQAAISVLGLPLTYSSGVLGINQAGSSQPGYLSATDWSLLHTATTTFSAPLVYTLATNAVTCPTCNISSLSGSGATGMLAAWSSVTGLTATGTPIAASYVATSSSATSTFLGAVAIQGNPTSPHLYVGTSTNQYPAYGFIPGDTIDTEWDGNGLDLHNSFNSSGGSCAGSGFVANGNVLAANSDYAAFFFTNTGWTGSGCSFGNGLERPESTVIEEPTGDIDIELGSTTPSTAINFFAGGNAQVKELSLSEQGILSLTAGNKFGIGSSTPTGFLSIAGSPLTPCTTPLIALSSSTSAFATTTVFQIDCNGNMTLAQNGSQILASGGASSFPVYSFSNATNYGMSMNGTSLWFTTNGTNRIFINSTGVGANSTTGGNISPNSGDSITVPNIMPDRSASNTGFGAGTTGNINAIVGGSEIMRWVSGGLLVATSTRNNCNDAVLCITATSTTNAAGQIINIASTTGASLLSVNGLGVTSIASSTFSSLGDIFGIGNDPVTTNGSSTIVHTGKLQADGYNTAGQRICLFVVGTTPTVGLGACNP